LTQAEQYLCQSWGLNPPLEPYLTVHSHWLQYQVEWEEGVEEFSSHSMENLWSLLGLKMTKTLPDFNDKIDPNTQNYWSDFEYMAANESSLCPLDPRWHQLVGIIKIVLQAFIGEPLILMNKVDVGKTLQLMGAIALIALSQCPLIQTMRMMMKKVIRFIIDIHHRWILKLSLGLEEQLMGASGSRPRKNSSASTQGPVPPLPHVLGSNPVPLENEGAENYGPKYLRGVNN
jgi:hypothetical protein